MHGDGVGEPLGQSLSIGLLTASASRQGGGVFEVVAAHCTMLRELGHRPAILTLQDEFTDQDRHRFGGAPVIASPVAGPAQIGYAPGLLPALFAAELDVVHLHGIWMYPSLAGWRWARKIGRPYVISPHGMLDPWITGRGRWKKRLAQIGYERRSWKAADAFHALTDQEARDIARETGADTVSVIPNAAPPAIGRALTGRPPHLAYIGRLHAKKNILALIEAWALLARAGRLPGDAKLTIAGWGDEGYVKQIVAAVAQAGPGIAYVGPVFGDAKEALLTKSRALILPSLSEGLPMAILEAWAKATPTIMTGECHLDIGIETGAALPCGHDAGSIADALATMLEMPEREWLIMAEAAQSLALGPFGSDNLARQWDGFYRSLVKEDSKPR